jgi:hypothetical protein
MTVESWLASASADADRRGLPALKPLLETLARSTAALRQAHAAITGAHVTSPAGATTPTDEGANR